MANKPPKNHLRLIAGGKSAEPKGRKVMTEIGLLDEADLEVWALVRQVAPPPDDYLLDEIEQEAALVQALLTERFHKLKERYPDADPNNMESMTPEMREIMFSPPLFVTPNGEILLID